MPGEKNKPQPTETTEVAPKYTLQLTTFVADSGYLQDQLVVTAELLKDGKFVNNEIFNWDSLGNYREDAREWAGRQYLIHYIHANGPMIEEEVPF